MIWTNASLFSLVLWFDLCGMLSWSRLVTIEPPRASGDPKAPSLSLCRFSLCRFWVVYLLGFWLFLSPFLFYFYFYKLWHLYVCYVYISFCVYWVYLFTRVIYIFNKFSLVCFFFFGFDFICLMGLVLKQKLYFVQHFSGVIILICCYYLI